MLFALFLSPLQLQLDIGFLLCMSGFERRFFPRLHFGENLGFFLPLGVYFRNSPVVDLFPFDQLSFQLRLTLLQLLRRA